MDLYVTGTLMHNRIPAVLTVKKNSAEYKKLSRGDFKTHMYQYKDDDDNKHCIGITCWKDSQMVYTLTTDCDTSRSDTCVRRTKDGLVTINRPHVIQQYNEPLIPINHSLLGFNDFHKTSQNLQTLVITRV